MNTLNFDLDKFLASDLNLELVSTFKAWWLDPESFEPDYVLTEEDRIGYEVREHEHSWEILWDNEILQYLLHEGYFIHVRPPKEILDKYPNNSTVFCWIKYHNYNYSFHIYEGGGGYFNTKEEMLKFVSDIIKSEVRNSYKLLRHAHQINKQ